MANISETAKHAFFIWQEGNLPCGCSRHRLEMGSDHSCPSALRAPSLYEAGVLPREEEDYEGQEGEEFDRMVALYHARQGR